MKKENEFSVRSRCDDVDSLVNERPFWLMIHTRDVSFFTGPEKKKQKNPINFERVDVKKLFSLENVFGAMETFISREWSRLAASELCAGMSEIAWARIANDKLMQCHLI